MTESLRKRILIIDDAALVRLYYRDILGGAGYHIEEALNGIEGLEKLLTTSFDLLIVDVNMPQMDGFTFLQTMRRQEPPTGSTPVLVTSTESGVQDYAAARVAGANFYLVKPVTREDLIEYVGLLSGSTV